MADRKRIIARLVDDFHKQLTEARTQETRKGEESYVGYDSEQDWAEALLKRWAQEQDKHLSRENDEMLSDGERDHIIMAVLDKSFGLGLLDRLLRDPDITDIHVMGSSHTMLRHNDGRWSKAPAIGETNDAVNKIIQVAAARHGGNIERRFDHKNPELNMQLKDGSRLFAVRDVVDSPQAVIRKHDHSLSSLKQLLQSGMMTPQAAHFLETAVRGRLNMIIVGSTGSGKTTMLRALCACMPPHEHKVTIEEAREIGLERDVKRHPLVRSMEVRPPDMSGQGGVEAQQLVRMSLRMDPDRIILGEVRGGEALQMLTAMTQGQSGSLCTMHGDSAESAYRRLQLYVKFGGVDISDEDVAQLIESAIHFVVFVTKEPVGKGRYHRIIHEIIETRSVSGTKVSHNVIMDRNNERRILAPVTKPSQATMPRLLAAGFDFEYFMSAPEHNNSGGPA